MPVICPSNGMMIDVREIIWPCLMQAKASVYMFFSSTCTEKGKVQRTCQECMDQAHLLTINELVPRLPKERICVKHSMDPQLCIPWKKNRIAPWDRAGTATKNQQSVPDWSQRGRKTSVGGKPPGGKPKPWRGKKTGYRLAPGATMFHKKLNNAELVRTTPYN